MADVQLPTGVDVTWALDALRGVIALESIKVTSEASTAPLMGIRAEEGGCGCRGRSGARNRVRGGLAGLSLSPCACIRAASAAARETTLSDDRLGGVGLGRRDRVGVASRRGARLGTGK